MTTDERSTIYGTPRGYVAIAIGLITLWLGLTFFRFEPAFLFHGDHERDLRYVTLLVQHGIWPESTPSISPTPFELGPIAYLLMAPGIAISPDPLIVQGYVLLLASLGFLSLYLCWCRRISPVGALVGLFALLSSTFAFELGRQLWHSSLLPLCMGGYFLAVERSLRDASNQRMIAIAALCAAIAVQLHLSASVYVLLGMGLILVRRRGILTGAIVGIVALIPFLWTNATILTSEAYTRFVSTPTLGRWAPASVADVLAFIVENIHTVWGDDVGPWLTWPNVCLAFIGSIDGIRRRDRFTIFLVANVLIGLAAESLLLGNQRAYRYMHANMWAVFALIGYGAHALTSATRPWVWRPLLIGIGLVVAVEAFISDVPRAHQRGWLNAREQRDVAAVVATTFPLASDDMERRVHGTYFGETMGLGHYHAIATESLAPDTRGESRSPFSDTAHVLVTPSDLPIDLSLLSPTAQQTIDGNARTIHVAAFEPRIREMRLPASLSARWRQSQDSHHGHERSVITVIVARDTTLTLMMSRSRRAERSCTLTATQAEPLRIIELETPRYPELRLVQIPATAGPLTIELGSCPTPRVFDLF